jgi:hypothetical protein
MMNLAFSSFWTEEVHIKILGIEIKLDGRILHMKILGIE